MTNLANKKIALIALASAILAITGCTTKANKSQVTTAPLGLYGPGNGGMMGGNYDGGALVNNSADVMEQGNSLQSIVYFAFDSSDLNPKSIAVLNQHAALLNKNTSSRILVVGHTDSRGSREYNMALGERRAQAVRDYLNSKGVNTSNIEITSRGEEEPAVQGNSESAHAQNRRAVLSY